MFYKFFYTFEHPIMAYPFTGMTRDSLFRAEFELCTEPITTPLPHSVPLDAHRISFFIKHSSELSTADPEYLTLVESAFQRYLGTDCQMEKLINKLLILSPESLEMMNRIIDKVEYGIKWKPAMDWLFSILRNLAASSVEWGSMTPTQKFVFSAQQIINCGISQDVSAKAECPLFHIAHDNIIPLLEDAHDENAIMKMCIDRLNPMHYKHPTTESLLDNIKNTDTIFGDFVNTVMKLSELKTYVPTAVLHQSGPLSSLTAHATHTILKSAAYVGGNISTGASCDMMLKSKIKSLNTVKQFVDFWRAHPDVSVFLVGDQPRHCRGYLATTTLSKDFLKVPYLWGIEDFSIETSSRMIDIPMPPGKMVPLLAVVPMNDYSKLDLPQNVFFVTADARYNWDPKISNCCHPAFLSTKVQHRCETVFEALNITMPLEIPPEPIVAGIVISDIFYNHHIEPLWLAINGTLVGLIRYC